LESGLYNGIKLVPAEPLVLRYWWPSANSLISVNCSPGSVLRFVC